MAPPRLEDFVVTRTDKDGTVLGGRYRIVGLLGTGSTAEVHLAADVTDETPVVVKSLFPALMSHAQMRERFVTGARATMAVTHASVARVYSVEEPEGEPPYVVMEALQGQSLADYLERNGPLPEPLALAFARQIATGLIAAHDAGIVHRDVKPANVFVVGEPGSTGKAKIIDFGFAKDTRDPDTGPSSSNLVLGTAQYMAPEQVLADPVDGRTDVYGFGVLMFRLLTAHLPFDLEPGADLFSHQLFSPIPPPSWLIDGLDPDLDEVVLRCVRKHPDNRYPSMQAVLEDLERIAAEADLAPLPLVRDPDVYKPRNPSGIEAAETLAAYFGTEPLPPATSRFDPDSQSFRRG